LALAPIDSRALLARSAVNCGKPRNAQANSLFAADRDRSSPNRHPQQRRTRMAVTVEKTADATAIRPFTIETLEADLDDLRARIAATRWPEKEPVEDSSQGVQLATMQALARYWETEYDWRRCEEKLTALPHFITEIDGVDIHFIHVRSEDEDALPLIVTHGWPGSVIEQLKIIDPLTNPTAHGASTADAFHLVIPSMPGYGFSGKPTETGWDRIPKTALGDRVRTSVKAVRMCAHPLARRGDRVAQLRAARPCRAAGARGSGELLDPHVHQLAAHSTVCPCVVPGLPNARPPSAASRRSSRWLPVHASPAGYPPAGADPSAARSPWGLALARQ
jgi:epoxide hydrolase-like protein